ncbi:MAG: nucleotide exchange factor GrpE [Gemmatimonadales bacterium]|nr:nucleotide exchange factor GrpE [Gemmatimonadales bacterium]NIN11277.1 nucleotide exchange factor GrpE [Gemmatimonadales bacterium]NIN49876.1 nucleotide exchange factor GrpE [Gemmatimonadales bacterium]NIP07340.1 nucleotide exchange factor GrpE [Gemmatimonadales bacterium]NIR03035.1 nucleotide exchange factor GrpE [Gemmatimonadales bacterium]
MAKRKKSRRKPRAATGDVAQMADPEATAESAVEHDFDSATETVEPDSALPTSGEAEAGLGTGVGLVELPEEAVRRLTGELEELNDKYLRLAAEFDNYRKRMARERSETWGRAQAELVKNVLDALDDLGRVVSLDVAQANVEDVVAGVDLVERKLMRQLEAAGLGRLGVEGETFDPNYHEAVGAMPAASMEQDGTVAAVLQPGYRLGSMLVRPARVRVFLASEAPVEETASEDGHEA